MSLLFNIALEMLVMAIRQENEIKAIQNAKEIKLPLFAENVFFFSLEAVLLCHSGWSAVEQSQFTETSASQIQVILLPQPPK